MKRSLRLALGFFAGIAFAAADCWAQKIDTEAEAEKVLQMSRDWSEAASTGDIEKTLSYWAEDAVLLSPGQAPLKGKEAIRKMVEESFKAPGFRISWEPQSVRISESGDMAYLIEKTEITFPGRNGVPVRQNHNTVTIWERQADGTWKNVVDIMTPEPAERE